MNGSNTVKCSQWSYWVCCWITQWIVAEESFESVRQNNETIDYYDITQNNHSLIFDRLCDRFAESTVDPNKHHLLKCAVEGLPFTRWIESTSKPKFFNSSNLVSLHQADTIIMVLSKQHSRKNPPLPAPERKQGGRKAQPTFGIAKNTSVDCCKQRFLFTLALTLKGENPLIGTFQSKVRSRRGVFSPKFIHFIRAAERNFCFFPRRENAHHPSRMSGTVSSKLRCKKGGSSLMLPLYSLHSNTRGMVCTWDESSGIFISPPERGGITVTQFWSKLTLKPTQG